MEKILQNFLENLNITEYLSIDKLLIFKRYK